MNGSARHPSHLENAMRVEADAEVDSLINAARQEAAGIVDTAKRAARRRLRKAVQAMRAERKARLDKAGAQLNAARRSRQQAIQAALLDEAMAQLAGALEKRWQDSANRLTWCVSIVEEARDRLEPGNWTIDHPQDWDASADTGLAEALTRTIGITPTFNPDPRITAGIRIRAGKACLDGTVNGLLARRSHIEAALLALLDETVAQGADAP